MKPSLRFVLGVSSVFFLFHGLSAAGENPSAAEVRRDIVVADKAPVEIRSARVTELLGHKVRNSRGDELAKIEDFLIDLENGRVVSTVLSGAAAGEGRVEVPARTFIYNKKERVLGWSGDEKRLAFAPRYSPPGSNRPAQAAHAAEVYGYYEETPYFLVDSQPARKVPGNVHTHGAVTTDFVAVPLGRLALASQLLGARINNDEGKKSDR